MSIVQKDLEDVSAGISIFFNPAIKNFVGNLTSKLARSNFDLAWYN
jgi:hypothetical protein